MKFCVNLLMVIFRKKLDRGQRFKCAKPQTLKKQKRQYHQKRLKEKQTVLK